VRAAYPGVPTWVWLACRMDELPRPPRDQLDVLVPADVRDGRTDRGEQAARVWDGVVWGRLGRGELAWACFDQVDDPDLRPWTDAERGRVLRELGLHAQAEEHDLAGLRRAADPVDEAMVWIGLTADAVGSAEVSETLLRLAAARDALDSAPDGARRDRQVLRLTWVETEVAGLVGDDPPDGPWPARDGDTMTWPDVFDAGTVFHRAKAALFAGALTRDLWMLDRAAELAPPVLAWAVHLARADLGVPGAEHAARDAWRAVTPPSHVAEAAASTPTARRLAGDLAAGTG